MPYRSGSIWRARSGGGAIPSCGHCLCGTAVAEGVLRSGGTLVFGGHPTISPIVLQIASMLGAGRRVVIYQSEQFAGLITDEVHRLAEVEGATIWWTPGHSDLDLSLQALRQEMFRRPLRAAFFVGWYVRHLG